MTVSGTGNIAQVDERIAKIKKANFESKTDQETEVKR